MAVDARMRCFGVDTDKAKVVGWVDRTIALPLAGTLAGINAVTTCLHPLCEAVGEVTAMLKKAVKRAAPGTAAGNGGRNIGQRLNDEIEPALVNAWREAAESENAKPRAVDKRPDPDLESHPEPTDPSRSIRAEWMRELQLAAMRLFDEMVPDAEAEHRDPFGRTLARHWLAVELSGRSARGRKVFTETLELPVPDESGRPARTQVAAPPAQDDRSLPATAWRWRNGLENTAKGRCDLAKLAHAHTLDDAGRVDAAKSLARELATHCDAETATIIATALALTRADGAFTAAEQVGQRRENNNEILRPTSFRRLLQARRNELIEPLRTLIGAIPDTRTDRRSLAADIAAWGPRVRWEWTNQYLRCRTEPAAARAYAPSTETENS